MDKLNAAAIEEHAIVKNLHIMNNLSASALSSLLLNEQDADNAEYKSALARQAEASEQFSNDAEQAFGEFCGYKLFSMTDAYLEVVRNEVDDNGAVTTYLSIHIEPYPSAPTVMKRVDTYVDGVHTPNISRVTDDDIDFVRRMLNHLKKINKNLVAIT